MTNKVTFLGRIHLAKTEGNVWSYIEPDGGPIRLSCECTNSSRITGERALYVEQDTTVTCAECARRKKK